MSKRSRTSSSRRRSAPPPRPFWRSRRFIGLGAAALLAFGSFVAIVLVRPTGDGTRQTAWAHLGTADVHSVAFAPGSADHLYFGHHNGILESQDGGRTWGRLAVNADAMGMQPAADGSIVIAGHEVFVGSQDGGRTWAPIAADLPDLDIHGFARDPADPARMWAYLAQGGVYESRDGGTRWAKVADGHRPLLVAARDASDTVLLGVDPEAGFSRSSDGGRTWTVLSQPDAYPASSIAATPDGRTILLGAPNGLLRSDDGGLNWSKVNLPAAAFAIAVSEDGRSIVVVTRSTDVYRSDDGGRTWPGPK